MYEFAKDLDEAIDKAKERGVTGSQIEAVACRRIPEVCNATLRGRVDLGIKVFVVLFCSIGAASICYAKFHAAHMGYKIPDDDVLNKTFIICFIAVVLQFFDVAQAVRMIRSLGGDK